MGGQHRTLGQKLSHLRGHDVMAFEAGWFAVFLVWCFWGLALVERVKGGSYGLD